MVPKKYLVQAELPGFSHKIRLGLEKIILVCVRHLTLDLCSIPFNISRDLYVVSNILGLLMGCTYAQYLIRICMMHIMRLLRFLLSAVVIDIISFNDLIATT